MQNFKSKETGEVFKYTGTFQNKDNKKCFRTKGHFGLQEKEIEFTNETECIIIIFNKNLDIEKAVKSREKIKQLGGYGYIKNGYSEFTGEKSVIILLLKYMLKEKFITDDFNFNCEQRNEIIKSLNLK
ncbi:MAG: hypothetical protein GY849_02610 [Deltaproteobacteria bacterium]|nr:hypothetical protein [Deltaproteobacteria bacterium]